ncbi:MAG: dicarboxylate/amino acid:cation symporter [Pirellulales bacterium]|nr:dicarboxylate/amino acid:cation symporter [Pirellulales bacterium]
MSDKTGLLDWYFKPSLLLRILAGLALGGAAGAILSYSLPQDRLNEVIRWIAPFGDIFIRLLKMIVVPVILFSLIVGTASINPARLGRVGLKIMAYYLFTSALAVAIGLAFAYVAKPGLGLNLAGAAGAAAKPAERPSLLDTFLNIVPTNPFDALARGDVLAVICFACVFGVALSYLQSGGDAKIKANAELVFRFFEGAAEIMYKIVAGVLEYAPIGVFALICTVIAKEGTRVIGPLGLTALTVYLALLAQLFVVYFIFLALFKFNFLRFLKGAQEAIVTAFVTRSSNGTLPVTMRVAEENLGVSRSISAFTLPLGATVNMNGTAIYLGVCATFVANAIGMPLTFAQMIAVVATATLAAIGTAGVPGSGALMLLMVFDSVGLKMEAGSAVAAGYAMIFGIDAVLDMGRTSMNVTGDIVGTVIVAKTENEIDLSKWTIGKDG